jgi:MerR family copper efflux transcriptional regulator
MEGDPMKTGEKELGLLTIGRLAEESEVSPKTIRYYEEVGLLPQPMRAKNGYRYYQQKAVHVLRFVGRAREMGFSMEETKELLALWGDKGRKSADVRAIALRHLETVSTKISKLQGLQATLQHLVHCCHGDERPDCPILDALAEE